MRYQGKLFMKEYSWKLECKIHTHIPTCTHTNIYIYIMNTIKEETCLEIKY